MTFDFVWTIKNRGKYAIRKTGVQAGKEIERKDKQSSSTHYFLNVKNEDLWKVNSINNKLKTITFNFVYEGTKEKSIRQYLSKKDIENIIQNIDTLKGQTITIELEPPKEARDYKQANKRIIKSGIEKMKETLIQKFGDKKTTDIFEMMTNRIKIEEEIQAFRRTKKKEIDKINEKLILLFGEEIVKNKVFENWSKYLKEQEGYKIRQREYRKRKK
jgi:hypothetical protein